MEGAGVVRLRCLGLEGMWQADGLSFAGFWGTVALSGPPSLYRATTYPAAKHFQQNGAEDCIGFRCRVHGSQRLGLWLQVMWRLLCALPHPPIAAALRRMIVLQPSQVQNPPKGSMSFKMT